MSQKTENSLFSRLYHGTSRLWYKFMPVSVETFIERVTDDDAFQNTERVIIDVNRRRIEGEPTYFITYEARQGDRVLLQAQERFSCLECKNAHLNAEGQIPSEVDEMVRKRAHRKVKDVKDVLTDAGINVSVHYTSS